MEYEVVPGEVAEICLDDAGGEVQGVAGDL